MIGNVVEKYEVIQKIGEGGMATVYRGRHTTLGREVAIKVLHPHLSASERNRLRFAREARAIEHLEHDNILKIFDYSGTDAENCYIVTEFVDGITLQALLEERGRFPSEIAAQIGLKLAQALDYAHELGIIHRDLKLENVMLRRDGALKLMDFGIARFLDEVNLTITGALVGSPAYMSPEQAMERVLDSRSDLFSLGTLLFHLVTGQLPFTGANPSIVLRNVIEGNRPSVLELAPDVSASLGDLIEQLLQTEASDRPTSAAEVTERLSMSLAEVGIVSADPTWSVQRWLQSPIDFEEKLRADLRVLLLASGKEKLVAKDHLSALRIFNRLLSIDEDNEEVLQLIRGMHADAPRTSRGFKPLLLGATILAIVALVTFFIWPTSTPKNESPFAGNEQASTDADMDESEAGDIDAPPQVVATRQKSPQAKASPKEALKTPPVSRAQNTPAPNSAAEPAPPPAARPGAVIITVPGSWGDIYIDGKLIGRTGTVGAIPVAAGTHILGIQNDHALPYKKRFTVEPGETKSIEVTDLQRKPVRFRLLGSPSPDCTVRVDGIVRGTVANLARTIRVRAPQVPHRLTLNCPDGTTLVKTLEPAAPGSLVPVNFSTP